MDALEDIWDGNCMYLNINTMDARLKICYCIRQAQSEWKGAKLLAKIMGKFLHRLFKVIVKSLKNSLPVLRESVPEVSHFIPEPRSFEEFTKFSAEIKIKWLKATLN